MAFVLFKGLQYAYVIELSDRLIITDGMFFARASYTLHGASILIHLPFHFRRFKLRETKYTFVCLIEAPLILVFISAKLL